MFGAQVGVHGNSLLIDFPCILAVECCFTSMRAVRLEPTGAGKQVVERGGVALAFQENRVIFRVEIDDNIVNPHYHPDRDSMTRHHYGQSEADIDTS